MPGTSISHGHNNDNSFGGSNSHDGTPPLNLEMIRSFFAGAIQNVQSKVSLDTVRPLTLFLGIGHNFCMAPEAFGPPVKKIDKSTHEKVYGRLKLNFAFFLSNYAIMTFGVALVVALMHPSMLMSLAMVYLLWMAHSYIIHHPTINIFGTMYNPSRVLPSITHRTNILLVMTTIVIVWKCLKPTLIFLAIATVLILTHACLRDPKHMDDHSYSHHFHSSTSHSADDDDSHSGSSEVLVDRPPAV